MMLFETSISIIYRWKIADLTKRSCTSWEAQYIHLTKIWFGECN